MKNIALLIAAVGSAVFFNETAIAEDAAKAPQTKKPGEQISPAIIKAAQPRNSPLSAPPKWSLPVNAGQQHGLAVVGGANSATAHKSGTINGTEVKRSR